MYRILAQNNSIRERRRIAAHPQTEIPRLLATRPNQVWTWDITKIPAAIGGYYNLYVILDLYSRCVVGWRLLRTESGAFAAMFVMETILTPGVDWDGLSIHADRDEHLQIQRIRQHALDRFWKEHPQSDLFVDDHWRHHSPTRSGSIDRNHQNRFLPNS